MWKTDGYLTSSNSYTSGTITIDGQNIQDVTQQSIHENIGIVQQEVFLFADTYF